VRLEKFNGISYSAKVSNYFQRLKDDAAVLNEVSILQSLRHPNILQVHDFFEEKEIFYIPMEYLAGGNIFGMIVQRNQFTEKDARDLAECLLDATKYIHECDIAHRDLKPQNLLIQDPSDNNTLKVADFGFAKRVYAPNCLRTRLGTPTYVAPEVLASKPYGKIIFFVISRIAFTKLFSLFMTFR